MIAPESNLHLLPWHELLADIQYLLEKEADRLRAKKDYYNSIYYKESTDKEKISKLYRRIVEDQQQFDFMNELLLRLDKYNAVVLLNALEQCETKEKAINGKIPDNWQITINKVQEKVSFYYYPIKSSC